MSVSYTMGKKGKKDSGTPSREMFQPLSVEGKTPATVVLLLSCPEEDILIKACEAVHAFADKGEENKVTLLGLGALEPLCQLINHNNKLVRRNAFMALGVMSTHVEVKNALKKLDVIPSIIDKLSPNEDTVVHEFGTLCLASLSVDFVSKTQIFDKNGLPPLIQLLSSPDPDVTKNSLEIIFNQVQDYQRHSALHELGVIPPLLEHLKSQFPVIQHLALRTLQNLTLDKDTCNTFRQEQGFEKLIDLLKNKELQDLHADALQVVANCLNDRECFRLIHKGGGLTQLMEFVLSSTIPEIQANAVKCIAGVAQSSENHNMLHELNVEKVLLELLSGDDDRVTTAASQAVSAMSSNPASKEVFRQLGGLAALVQLLSSESLTVTKEATRALFNLTTNNLLNVMEVFEAGGHERLIQLLKQSCPRTVASAAATLSNMAGQEHIRSSILSHGAMEALVEPLKSADTQVLVKAALCVAVLACDRAECACRAELKSAGGFPPLVNLLDFNNTEVQKMACLAVKACAGDEHSATEMCVLGAIEKLKKINQAQNQNNRVSELAMSSLLNFNLPVKYSLTGFLSSTDHVKDGFYDAGKAVEGRRVLSLEEHYSQPVNQHRAILVINTAKQAAEKKTEDDSQKDTDRADSHSTTVKPCKMKNDPSLQALVQQVRERILPLEDKRKQYAALARVVSQAMGGAVEMEKMHTFEWTLHLSELKCQLQSNVVPIGMINRGIYCHRALLFKCLADSIGLTCTLVRGEYSRAWNEVLVFNKSRAEPPCRYVVDLIHNPGCLLRVHTPAAEQYQTI